MFYFLIRNPSHKGSLMEALTRREEQIMLSIYHLEEDAYLVQIKKHLSKLLKKRWSIGAIHIPLRRLERDGYLESFFGEATAVRGGRRKKIYKVTKKGMKALTENKKVNDLLWENFPELEYK